MIIIINMHYNTYHYITDYDRHLKVIVMKLSQCWEADETKCQQSVKTVSSLL